MRFAVPRLATISHGSLITLTKYVFLERRTVPRVLILTVFNACLTVSSLRLYSVLYKYELMKTYFTPLTGDIFLTRHVITITKCHILYNAYLINTSKSFQINLHIAND
jgi:hypothetical protein